jgi:hypothetical protein
MKAFLVWKFLRSYIILDMFKYWSDRIKKNEMGGACGTYGGDVSCIEVLVGESEGKNHLENLGVDRRIILTYIFKVWYGKRGMQ